MKKPIGSGNQGRRSPDVRISLGKQDDPLPDGRISVGKYARRVRFWGIAGQRCPEHVPDLDKTHRKQADPLSDHGIATIILPTMPRILRMYQMEGVEEARMVRLFFLCYKNNKPHKKI